VEYRSVGRFGPASAGAPLTARGSPALFDQQRHELVQPGAVEIVQGSPNDVVNLALGQLRIRLLQPGDDVSELKVKAVCRRANVRRHCG
jgi:hypothetical protein